MDSFHIWYKWSIAWEGVSHVMTLDLDLYLQGRWKVGVRRSGRRVRSPSGDYSTANDAWKSNVHNRHASPWRRIVASWRLVIVTSYKRCAGNGLCCPGDHQEFGGIFVAKRYQIFGTAVSERPGHFLISWLGAVGSRWTLNREKVGI